MALTQTCEVGAALNVDPKILCAN